MTILQITTEILTDAFFAALAGIGFGAISNPPRRAFVFIALLAAMGHALRFVLMHHFHYDIATASLYAGLLIGFTSVPFGYFCHCPTTVLYMPALLPMIPGKFAYNTLFSIMMFLQNMGEKAHRDMYMDEFFSNGIVTISVVFLLAVGATMPVFLLPRGVYRMTRHMKKSDIQ
ncbi:MAG TPA: threonine/serine exporter family protein [Bacteroidaceae bacterium]|nr:threonine/serine exporter family protein [Bacteroidaceae bacterium]